MTRLPNENQDVRGVAYDDTHPKYKVGPLCSVPTCSRLADHAHHIWRRSFLIGDYGWVRLWDRTVVQNLTGLCYRHHQDITENKSFITYVTNAGFMWSESTFATRFCLDPQPKQWANNEIARNTLRPEEHEHGPGAVEKCPTCNRRIPKETTEKQPKRLRKEWKITVPVDERENGADVLDTLLGGCAELFGHDETKQVRYFTIVQALALVVQHGHRFVSDE